MIIYPLLAELVFRTGAAFGPAGSWWEAVGESQHWTQEPPLEGKTIWMHCASLGEFEMGRPVLEQFLDRHEHWQAVVTFFSPSGYGPRKNYARAKVHYLPFDRPTLVKKWLAYVQPDLALMVRYDVWPNHIAGLRRANVPVVVMGMSAPKTPWYLSRVLPLIRKNFMAGVHTWGVVSEADAACMSMAGVHSKVLGNPKYDYAAALVGVDTNEKFTAWKRSQEKPVLLVGSAHVSDCEALNGVDLREYSLWLVPHDLRDTARLLGVLTQYEASQVLDSTQDEPKATDVLMVPEFGVLVNLYGLADGVVIGGGWDKATHNVLEATAQGKIAACGPNWQTIAENKELVERGFLQPIQSHEDWIRYLDQVGTEEFSAEGRAAQSWMIEQRGAAEKIVKVLEEAVQL
jgi:3-deoxy-D-manno-octulosonic-acid transferase